MAQTILQHPILTNFIYPFLIVFFILFAVLERTKILGEGDNKSQLNAFLSFVIGLVFVSAVFPKQAVENLVLFLSVAVVILFVFMVIWGFISSGGGEGKDEGVNLTNGMKIALYIIGGIAVVIAVLWAFGVGTDVYNFFIDNVWTSAVITNVIFIVLIGVALAAILKQSGGGGGKDSG